MARTAGALLGRSEDSGNKTFAGHMTRKGESCEQREGEGFCLCSAAAPPAPFFFLPEQASKQARGGEGGTRRDQIDGSIREQGGIGTAARG